uniref:Glycoside hydrolase family 31 n=1 Tax=Callosobruchus maculatus TaxID=64391 RepID=X2D6S3_CALMS|nr:glycoside hydrolase family 31 [Callosobruchus maculatus]
MARLSFALLGIIALYHTIYALEVTGGPERSIIIIFTDNDGATAKFVHRNQTVLLGKIGYGRDAKGDYYGKDGILTVTPIPHGFNLKWETNHTNIEFKDCFQFQDDVHWFGGPQRKQQYWPVEKMKINSSEAYVLKQLDNFSVAEYYWLTSNGVYIHVNERTPLFVDQNIQEPGKICFIAKAESPYINRTRVLLEYDVIIEDNAREAHLHAIKNVLGKPSGHPNPKMVKEPIWTTWAKYKAKINDSIVLEFAEGIRKQKYSAGQLEIDDAWEKCYGAQEFDPSPEKFSDIENTIKKLKELDFRVTLWVHPFVDDDCHPRSEEGKKNGYFVKDPSGGDRATWWNGQNSHQIDFTNPDAAKWYTERLRKLQKNPGIDAFKFDAGETNYGPQPSVYNIDPELVPNALSKHYVETCAQFGDLIEVRSAWRTQSLPIFIRMIDKDSNWGIDNGLYTLVTTLFQMNLNGYPMVLPDMIGGNGYGQLPDAELIVRWTQANTFMPAMQFSYLPWEITSKKFDAPKIVKKFVDLHAEKSDIILEAMKEAVKSGHPVNPPIWWIAPEDPIALACDTEYLVGEKILVAPILEQGATSRKIYLPAGNWTDGNNGKKYKGPVTIDAYPAPIDVLPWFTRDA